LVGRALIQGDFETALKLAIGTPARKDSGPTRALSRALANHWGDWNTALANFGRMPERGAIETLARGGSFKDAFVALPKFTQEICVEAYQSHLWNQIARELADALAEQVAQSAFEADDNFGPLIFPRAAALTPAFRELPIPVPSPRAIMPECLSEIVAGILADEGVTLETLHIPGLQRPYFGGGDRPFVARARHWSISPPGPDEFAGNSPANLACTVRFELPRGSYATVLLRALGQ
jgi:tRNA(Glu) U13 pseudouridine synthase TruD